MLKQPSTSLIPVKIAEAARGSQRLQSQDRAMVQLNSGQKCGPETKKSRDNGIYSWKDFFFVSPEGYFDQKGLGARRMQVRAEFESEMKVSQCWLLLRL